MMSVEDRAGAEPLMPALPGNDNNSKRLVISRLMWICITVEALYFVFMGGNLFIVFSFRLNGFLKLFVQKLSKKTVFCTLMV